MDQADLAELGYTQSPEQLVSQWAALAQQSGLDGVVCSAHEAALLRQQRGDGFLLVTPGIRLDVVGNNDDQRRIMTPQQALSAGASYLVIGRPIVAGCQSCGGVARNQFGRGVI